MLICARWVNLLQEPWVTKPEEALAVRFHWCTKTQSDECFPKAFDYTMSIPSPRVCLQGCVCWACGEGVTFSALLLFVFILFCFIFPRPALTSLRFEVGYSTLFVPLVLDLITVTSLLVLSFLDDLQL